MLSSFSSITLRMHYILIHTYFYKSRNSWEDNVIEIQSVIAYVLYVLICKKKYWCILWEPLCPRHANIHTCADYANSVVQLAHFFTSNPRRFRQKYLESSLKNLFKVSSKISLQIFFILRNLIINLSFYIYRYISPK